MVDDTFCIGEYIDTGKLKGTVEGMSRRGEGTTMTVRLPVQGALGQAAPR